MNVKMVELHENFAKEICNEWRYDGEYSVYNVPWDEAVKQNWSIADEAKRNIQFRGVIDENNRLIGFFRMTKDDNNDIEIGLGMHPELCGQGFGKEFVKIITDYAHQKFPEHKLYVEVRTFNKRAFSCYNSSGYRLKCQHKKVTALGIIEYFRMEFDG